MACEATGVRHGGPALELPEADERCSGRGLPTETRTAARLGLRSQLSAVRGGGDAPFAVMHGDGDYVYMVACSLVAATKEQTAMPNSDCWDRGCRLGRVWSLVDVSEPAMCTARYTRDLAARPSLCSCAWK